MILLLRSKGWTLGWRQPAKAERITHKRTKERVWLVHMRLKTAAKDQTMQGLCLDHTTGLHSCEMWILLMRGVQYSDIHIFRYPSGFFVERVLEVGVWNADTRERQTQEAATTAWLPRQTPRRARRSGCEHILLE